MKDDRALIMMVVGMFFASGGAATLFGFGGAALVTGIVLVAMAISDSHR